MTKRTFDAAIDCTCKIKELSPTNDKVKEMLSFLSMMDRLCEICKWEGPSGIRLEVDNLPENTAYEKAFKESIYLWMNGSNTDEASDHVAERYFEENPSGYDAAIFFAAVFGVGKVLSGELAYGFIDQALQYLLPDGWRWREEDEKEEEAHKDDEDWFPLLQGHRKTFLGEPLEEIQHRFDDIAVYELITRKDALAFETGRRIADKLPHYKDGALQLILKELTYHDLVKLLYVVPEEVEARIVSNLDTHWISTIKGQCILNKDTVSAIDIRFAVKKLEEAIDAYDGDPSLEAEYEN